MVGKGVEATLHKPFGQRLDLLARHRIDDAGLAMVLVQKLEELCVGVGLCPYGVADVGPVEAADELLGAIEFEP